MKAETAGINVVSANELAVSAVITKKQMTYPMRFVAVSVVGMLGSHIRNCDKARVPNIAILSC